MLNGVKHLSVIATNGSEIFRSAQDDSDAPSTVPRSNAKRQSAMSTKQYFVYILASVSKTLYVGVTSDLVRRVYQHKHHLVSGFTSRYDVTRLVHFETTGDVRAAIAREKQLKGWVRRKKIALIEEHNPHWHDLSAGWFDVEGNDAKR
jgi:putative endonuclease